MNILFIGDIVGRPGRELIRKGARALAEKHGADLVIANAENSANGFGITKDIGDAILELGVDVKRLSSTSPASHVCSARPTIPPVYRAAVLTLRARGMDARSV